MNDGWVKITRSCASHWIYSEKPYDKFHAWVDLILLASHKDVKLLIEGELRLIKRGSFHTSILKLADRWGWDRKKVSRFLVSLERDGMVTTDRTTHGTTVTLVNYEKYQGQGTTDNPTNDATTTPTDGQPLPTIKNIKNIKKGRIGMQPTREEVHAYKNEIGSCVDADKFFDTYEKSGWRTGEDPINDWKAVFRKWEQSEHSNKRRKTENDTREHEDIYKRLGL